MSAGEDGPVASGEDTENVATGAGSSPETALRAGAVRARNSSEHSEMNPDESKEDEDAAAFGDGANTAPDLSHEVAAAEDSLSSDVSEALGAYVDENSAPTAAPSAPSAPSDSDPFASEYDWDPSDFKEVEAVDSIEVDLRDDLFEDG